MATNSKVTALSLRGNELAVERDGKVRESKLYHLTPASLARVCRVVDSLPWKNVRLAFIEKGYFVAENADVHSW